jgi:hypothetical protein
MALFLSGKVPEQRHIRKHVERQVRSQKSRFFVCFCSNWLTLKGVVFVDKTISGIILITASPDKVKTFQRHHLFWLEPLVRFWLRVFT